MKKEVYQLLSEEILGNGKNLRIPIWGCSMSPFVRSGDILTIKPSNVTKISIGDIIVFRMGQRMVAHRLIKKYKQKGKIVLLTKGDSLTYYDHPVFPKDLLGRVVSIERENRRINQDNARWRLLNRSLAKVSPFSLSIYPVLRNAKRGILKKLGNVRVK